MYPTYIVHANEWNIRTLSESNYKYRGGHRTTYTYEPDGSVVTKDRIGREGPSRTKTIKSVSDTRDGRPTFKEFFISRGKIQRFEH